MGKERNHNVRKFSSEAEYQAYVARIQEQLKLQQMGIGYRPHRTVSDEIRDYVPAGFAFSTVSTTNTHHHQPSTPQESKTS